MYYKLNENQLETLKNIQKIVPIKYEIMGDFINVEDLLNYLFDLYYEFTKFIDLTTK